MAIDIKDVMENNDFVIVDTDRYKAYNLLNPTEKVATYHKPETEDTPSIEDEGIIIDILNDEEKTDDVVLEEIPMFPENPSIGLNLAKMIQSGLNSAQIQTVIVEYLQDFGVVLSNIEFSINKSKGEAFIRLSFPGE